MAAARLPWAAALGALVLLLACGRESTHTPLPSDQSGPDFAPARDTTLAGLRAYRRVHVPPGVVVTAGGALELVARERMTIEGTVRGPGQRIVLRSRGPLDLRGVVSNGIDLIDASLELLHIVGNDSVVVTGATIEACAAAVLTNDSSLVAQEPRAPFGADSSGVVILRGTVLRCLPARARDGAPGPSGADGASAPGLRVAARGDLVLDGASLEAASGGAGGAGSHSSELAAEARGGAGGAGGAVRLEASRALRCTSGSSIAAGAGGPGGAASAIGVQSTAPGALAASGRATGGAGGAGGDVELRAGSGIHLGDLLAIQTGSGGQGGAGTARGANGLAAGVEPAQRGGQAEAEGGAGGGGGEVVGRLDTPWEGPDLLRLAEVRGGDGGPASATAGDGGRADSTWPNGAPGGSAVARGGAGGSSTSAAGSGGAISLSGGNGGGGAGTCLGTQTPGGSGGAGGDASGADGQPGSGTHAGIAGGVHVTNFGSGGPGGDGRPAGAGGAPGMALFTHHGALEQDASSFRSGPNGLSCPISPGACCTASGACELLVPDECAERNGTFRGEGTACDPNPCPEPSGACCLSDGSCVRVTAPECGTAGGVFAGAGIPCSEVVCGPVACCLQTGECRIQVLAECALSGGTAEVGATACDPNPCPQPQGACCSPSGDCSITSGADCPGAYQGDYTTCDPNPCPRPTAACCFANGTCLRLSASSCAAEGGSPGEEGSACDPNPCVQPTGACCGTGGGCTVTTAAECGGVFQGAFTSCDPNPCPAARLMQEGEDDR